MNNEEPQFQIEPQVRAVFLFAVIGWLTARYTDMPEPITSAVGAILGSLFDWGVFEVKKLVKRLKAKRIDE
jgi:di/tricarboxylate transporter